MSHKGNPQRHQSQQPKTSRQSNTMSTQQKRHQKQHPPKTTSNPSSSSSYQASPRVAKSRKKQPSHQSYQPPPRLASSTTSAHPTSSSGSKGSPGLFGRDLVPFFADSPNSPKNQQYSKSARQPQSSASGQSTGQRRRDYNNKNGQSPNSNYQNSRPTTTGKKYKPRPNYNGNNKQGGSKYPPRAARRGGRGGGGRRDRKTDKNRAPSPPKYCGPAWCNSPSPSSLPVPKFIMDQKEQQQRKTIQLQQKSATNTSGRVNGNQNQTDNLRKPVVENRAHNTPPTTSSSSLGSFPHHHHHSTNSPSTQQYRPPTTLLAPSQFHHGQAEISRVFTPSRTAPSSADIRLSPSAAFAAKGMIPTKNAVFGGRGGVGAGGRGAAHLPPHHMDPSHHNGGKMVSSDHRIISQHPLPDSRAFKDVSQKNSAFHHQH